MNKLKDFRKKSGLTQKQLADLSGLTKSAICNYENGSRTPVIKQAYKVISALNQHGVACDLDDLFPVEQCLHDKAA